MITPFNALFLNGFNCIQTKELRLMVHVHRLANLKPVGEKKSSFQPKLATILSLAVFNTCLSPALAMPGWRDTFESYWSTKTAQPALKDEPHQAPKMGYGTWVVQGATQLAKGLQNLAHRGVTYAMEHPFQAFTLGLAAQAGFANAIQSLTRDVLISSNVYNPFNEDFRTTSITSGNRVLATWTGFVEGYRTYYGRWMTLDGNALTPEIPIGPLQSTYSVEGSLTSLPDGNIFTAWSDYFGSTYEIYARTLAPNGTFATNPFRVNQYAASNQFSPFVTTVSGNLIVTTWTGDQGGDYDVYLRRMDTNGTFLGGDILVNQVSGSAGQRPKGIATLGDAVLITWEGFQTGFRSVYARQMAANGTFLGDEFCVNKNIVGEKKVTSVITLGNTFVIAWQGSQTGTPNIYARKINVDGTFAGDEFGVNQNTTGANESPSLATWGNDHGVITWVSPEGIKARVMGPDGFLGDEFRINQNTTDAYKYPSVTLQGNTAFFAWLGGKSPNYKVFGRTFDLSDLLPDQTTAANVQTTAGWILTTSFASTTGDEVNPPLIPILFGVGGPIVGCSLLGGSFLVCSLGAVVGLKWYQQQQKKKASQNNTYGTPAEILKEQSSVDHAYGTPADILKEQSSSEVYGTPADVLKKHLTADHAYGTPADILKEQQSGDFNAVTGNQPPQNPYGRRPVSLIQPQPTGNAYQKPDDILKEMAPQNPYGRRPVSLIQKDFLTPIRYNF